MAIDAIAEKAGFERGDDYMERGKDLKINLSYSRKCFIKNRACLSDDELEAIVQCAKEKGDATLFTNLVEAMEQILRDTPDPRDMSIVLKTYPSPRFRLPEASVPCIMIGGGTGLAPFRSFWQALAIAGRPANDRKHMLIIQQRTRRDMVFEDEILAMVNAGILDVEIIFSQDECLPVFGESEIHYEHAPGRKGYIDKLIEGETMQRRLAAEFSDYGAQMYVCGTGGLAKTAVDALMGSFCNEFGETRGQEILEKMVAENRLVLDIFTNLSRPVVRPSMALSDLCQCNDILGTRKGNKRDRRLLLVINSSVYDMKSLFRLHPGGDTLLKLYCGMDATTAWNAVKHDKQPEVVAMLEMFDTKMTLHDPTQRFSQIDKDWYKQGWREMTMTLVEVQNALRVAINKTWDVGTLSSAEENLGEHFTVWKGKAVWRSKRSLLKGEFFADSHNRLWSTFLPLLFSDTFDELRHGLGEEFIEQTDLLLSLLEASSEHLACDAICPLIKQELDRVTSNILPPTLQAYMEELREADNALLENIKARLITGLRVFETETNKSPFLPAFQETFEEAVLVSEIKFTDKGTFISP